MNRTEMLDDEISNLGRIEVRTPYQRMRDHAYDMERQRDELVLALESIVSEVTDIDPRLRYVETQLRRDELADYRALIAKVKESK